MRLGRESRSRRHSSSESQAELTEALSLRTQVGSVELADPVCLASGTAGHGAELASYLDLSSIGAVVVKSLSAQAWPGNPAPRLRPASAGMLNSIGLQGPGVQAWIQDDLPGLLASGAKVVASIWGRTVQEFEDAAILLRGVEGVAAVEVNVSCPNVEDRRRMFAHSASATAEAIHAASACSLPMWAKLSPNVADITDIASAALEGGAEALVLVNTLLAMAIDIDLRRPALGAGGGGLSGAALHPVAVRAVWDCHAAFPNTSLVGVGGVSHAHDALELIMAGASAIEVGTATFSRPTAAASISLGMRRWCDSHGITELRELVGSAHG